MPVMEANGSIRPVDIQDEMLAYKMPPASGGLVVSWYKNGKKKKADERIALVNRVTPLNVDLFVLDPNDPNPHKEYVSHIEDPRLKIGQGAFAEFGAWDYTESYKQDQEWRAECNRRMVEMEGQILQLQKKLAYEASEKAARVQKTNS